MGRRKTVAAKDALPAGRQDEQCKLVGTRGRIGHDGKAVICTDSQSLRQGDDLLAGIFVMRIAGGGAIGEKNIGPAFGNMPAVGMASCRCGCAPGAARELPRFALENGPGIGPNRLRLAKDLEGIVAGWIGLWG